MATQSSQYGTGDASRANDGVEETDYSKDSCSHTSSDPDNSGWWQVDLGTDAVAYDVVSVIITNRGDCCSDRLQDFDVYVYDEDPLTSSSGTLCIHHDGPMGMGVTEELTCDNGPIRGRFVRVVNTPGQVLTLCEVQVMAVPEL